MQHIDRLAYANRLTRLHPAYKLGCSVLALAHCLAVPHPVAGLSVLVAMLALSIVWAGLPPAFVLKLALGEAGFLALGVLGVAVSVSASEAPGLNVGPLWFSVSPDTLWTASVLFTRALGGAAAMNFLALTTPIVAVVDLLRALRVPDLLIDLMTLIYRFTFTLFNSLERMTLAHEVRLGFRDGPSSVRSAADIGANLFVEAFRRSRRLDLALQGRGWDGVLRVLPESYDQPRWLNRGAGR